MEKLIEDESGAATIIEYTIVLPIVMAIIMVLMFTGYLFYDRATMEAATERTALYVSKTIADQNYSTLTSRNANSNEIEDITIKKGSISTAPYRYLFGSAEDVGSVEADARNLIIENQLLSNDSVDVSVTVSSFVFHKVTVTATEEFAMPTFLASLKLPPLVSLKTEAVVYVNEPAEFIRNADLAVDLLKRLDAGLGISEKLHSLTSQISFFKSNTK